MTRMEQNYDHEQKEKCDYKSSWIYKRLRKKKKKTGSKQWIRGSKKSTSVQRVWGKENMRTWRISNPYSVQLNSHQFNNPCCIAHMKCLNSL